MTIDDITDKNLFAYCDNNPIMRIDGEGYRWNWGKSFAAIGIVAGAIALGAMVVISCGTAAPVVALVGGGIFSGGLGFSATTVATASTVAYWAGVGAVYSTAASTGIYLIKTKSETDPYARPGQKEQGRENKYKSRSKDDFKSRNNKRNGPPKPKKHTPGNDHKKY